jgi:hypothetical protein
MGSTSTAAARRPFLRNESSDGKPREQGPNGYLKPVTVSIGFEVISEVGRAAPSCVFFFSGAMAELARGDPGIRGSNTTEKRRKLRFEK